MIVHMTAKHHLISTDAKTRLPTACGECWKGILGSCCFTIHQLVLGGLAAEGSTAHNCSTLVQFLLFSGRAL